MFSIKKVLGLKFEKLEVTEQTSLKFARLSLEVDAKYKTYTGSIVLREDVMNYNSTKREIEFKAKSWDGLLYSLQAAIEALEIGSKGTEHEEAAMRVTPPTTTSKAKGVEHE